MAKDIEVTKHVLVPKHAKLGEKEKKDLLGRYAADLRDFPRIFRDDPAIQKLDAKAGDIIRIVRPSPTAGEAVFYRRVASR